MQKFKKQNNWGSIDISLLTECRSCFPEEALEVPNSISRGKQDVEMGDLHAKELIQAGGKSLHNQVASRFFPRLSDVVVLAGYCLLALRL